MSDLIKKIKIKKQDGTYTDYIPIGAEAKNVDCSDGESVEYKLNKKPYYYNSVADMKADKALKVGDMAVTLGYYEPNDGGGAEYRIIKGTYEDDGGSCHKLGNNLYAELIVKDKKINVNQFGAKGDGQTDDSLAIQNAIIYAGEKGFKDVLFINYRYYCKSSLIINYSEFKLHGQPMTEYGSGIKFDTNLEVGIDVKSYGFRMDNLCLLTEKGNNNLIGLRLIRPIGTGTYNEIENAMNIDADIINCSFLWLHIGIQAKGRNINIDICEFGECEIGVDFGILSNGHSHRDMWIRNSRFHNIGVYQRETKGYEYGIAIRFPDTWVRADFYGNIIRNNFFDYCNNIFEGCILGTTISDNNILDCLHNGIVAVNPNEGSMTSVNNIEVMISNNNMNLRGNETNYGIYLKGVSRPRIIGNIIANQPQIGVLLENCSTIWFANNSLNCAKVGITENLKIIGNTGDEIFLTGNLFSSFQNVNNTYVNISGVSKIYSGGNVNIGSSTPIVSNVVPYKQGEEAHFW